MYGLLGFVQFVAYVAIIVIAAVYVRNYWQVSAPRREHLARKAELGRAPALYDDADYVLPETARAKAFQFLGLPTVHPGGQVLKVPEFTPGQGGRWQADREVITIAKIKGFTRRGLDYTDMIELDGGYTLAVAGGKSYIFVKHALTGDDEDLLKEKRQDACDRGTASTFIFEGQAWTIRFAMGKNPTSSGRPCSSIQVLGIHPDLGNRGRVSMLPPALMDGKEHDYFDLRARSGEQVMFAFYAGEKWTCFIGRQLTDEEVAQMQGI